MKYAIDLLRVINFGAVTNNNIRGISRLLDTSAWSIFVTDELKAKGATAIGSPTLEMYVLSYNETNPERPYSPVKIEGVGYEVLGKIKADNDHSGKAHDLYFPYTSPISECISYCLSSPCIDSKNIHKIYYNHNSNGGDIWSNIYTAIRPVVCIPSNLLEYNSATSSWDINVTK